MKSIDTWYIVSACGSSRSQRPFLKKNRWATPNVFFDQNMGKTFSRCSRKSVRGSHRPLAAFFCGQATAWAGARLSAERFPYCPARAIRRKRYF